LDGYGPIGRIGEDERKTGNQVGMDSISWNQVVNYIFEDDKINFIAEAMTPLHVLGIEALILYLERKGFNCKGFILAIDHAATGKGLDESMFHRNCYSGVVPYSFIPNQEEKKNDIKFYLNLKKNITKSNTFIYATPFVPSFDRIPLVMGVRPNDNLQIYLTEEGIASYLSNPYKLYYHRLFKPKLYRYPKIIWKNLIRNRFYKSHLIKADKLHTFSILQETDGTYVSNEEFSISCKEIFKTYTSNRDYSQYEGAIVFTPSLLFEGGVISKRIDVEIYESIKRVVGEKCNYIVKPHPREKNLEAYSSLNCYIERDYKDSFESIIAKLGRKPKCIIGDMGSALVNVSALFGVKTISISKLIDDECLLIKNYFDAYNEAFKNLVYIPETFDELKNYLEEL